MKARNAAVPAAAAMLAVFAVYLATMAPSLSWAHYGADGGDLLAAVAVGSLPHPPGFPAYLLLGSLFARLPWGDLAWRLNLMSALLAAGAAGLVALSAGEFLPSAQREEAPGGRVGVAAMPIPALCAGLCLGLAPLFWSQALIAEVYAPAALFASLALLLALRRAPAWLCGLAVGLGTGIHPTLFFIAPLVAWAAWRQGEKWLAGRLVLACGAILLGWLVMYGIALPMLARAPSPWGGTSTLQGWWSYVSGQLYRGYLFGLPVADLPGRFLSYLSLLTRQFTPIGALIAALGFSTLWQRNRSLAAGSGAAFACTSIYAIGYDTADSLVYIVPALPLAALWLACGLEEAGRFLAVRTRLPVAALLLALPLVQAVLFWGRMDVSGDRSALDWARSVLAEAPQDALMVTATDRQTFALWYAREVLGERPDVVVVDRDLWGWEPYREHVVRSLGIGLLPATVSPEEAAQVAGRPVVSVDPEYRSSSTSLEVQAFSLVEGVLV
jgi:hypothetical protein